MSLCLIEASNGSFSRLLTQSVHCHFILIVTLFLFNKFFASLHLPFFHLILPDFSATTLVMVNRRQSLHLQKKNPPQGATLLRMSDISITLSNPTCWTLTMQYPPTESTMKKLFGTENIAKFIN